jgi:preprotein translocase subunit YajC
MYRLKQRREKEKKELEEKVDKGQRVDAGTGK